MIWLVSPHAVRGSFAPFRTPVGSFNVCLGTDGDDFKPSWTTGGAFDLDVGVATLPIRS
jgi:hypothetical protein